MCLGGDSPPAPTPQAPAQVLEQEAPKKKSANQQKANRLALGTKKYRNDSGLNSGKTHRVRPQGPTVSY